MFLVLASLLLKMKQVNLYNTLSGYAKHIDVASQVFQIFRCCSLFYLFGTGHVDGGLLSSTFDYLIFH